MSRFIPRHREEVIGRLNGFDRLRFRGSKRRCLDVFRRETDFSLADVMDIIGVWFRPRFTGRGWRRNRSE